MSINTHLPGDPVEWVKDLEKIWQSRDANLASQGYTEDAVLYWGMNQSQTGDALRNRPKKWFEFAKDLQIQKKYIAHSDHCIVTSWDSQYTNPNTNIPVFERGIETFYFRDGLIYEQHAWQHSWQEGDKVENKDFSTS